MELSDDVKQLLNAWKVISPTPDIIEYAQQCIEHKGKSASKIAIDMGLAKTDGPGKDLRSLLSEHGASDDYDLIKCIGHQVLYLRRQFGGLSVNAAFRQTRKISDELKKIHAIPMVAPGGNFMLFSEWDSYRDFTHMGRAERLQSSVWEAMQREGKWVYAIASKSLYLQITNSSDYEANTNLASSGGQSTLMAAQKGLSENHNKLITTIEFAFSEGASDISMYPDGDVARVYFRLNKQLREQPALVLDLDVYRGVTNMLRQLSGASRAGERLRKPESGQITYRSHTSEIAIRCSFLPLDNKGSDEELVSIDLRLLARKTATISLDGLGIDEKVKPLLKSAAIAKTGMVIVSGPVNSGKSTTLAAMLDAHRVHYGNRLKRISIEDPVEQHLPGVLHVQVPQYLENDGIDPWEAVLKEVLRHDPNVVNMQEIRDEKSANLCLQAATTGNLTFSTTHSNDVLGAYRRIRQLIDPSDWGMLIDALVMLVSQRLLPKVCPHCSEMHAVNDDQREAYAFYASNLGMELRLPEKIATPNPGGCNHCQLGYSGMVVVNELLPIRPEVKRLLENANHLMMQDLYQHCVVLMQQQANDFLHQGVITLDDAMI